MSDYQVGDIPVAAQQSGNGAPPEDPQAQIPQAQDQAGREASGQAPGTSPRFRLLILEDEDWDAQLALRLLRAAELNFTVEVAGTREEFTVQLEEFRPEIILSDYYMPGFSGEAALAIARQRCPEVPFIIWSGLLGDEVAVGLIKQGATDYLLKDRPARLPSAIKRALAEARSRDQLARLEEQLTSAQRLAGLGQLAAAEQAVKITRDMLVAARSRLADETGQV
jgi:DNA-binding NtrC family response regulator